MKKIPFLIVMALPVYATLAFAGPADKGSGDRGFTINLGYDRSFLHYAEASPTGQFLDKDVGYLYGLAGEARFENKDLWSRLVFELTRDDNIRYTGFLQTIPPTPYEKEDVTEKYARYEADSGYKALNVGTSTFTPYAGIGYWWWKRGEDMLPDYLEKYSWYYAVAGINCVWRLNRWSVGADVSAHLPFDMKMRTNTAGTTNEAVFSLAKIVGYSVELPATYYISRPERKAGFFIFLTPYYQYWPIGASPAITVTRTDGSGSILVYEPTSRSSFYGVKSGLGANF